MPSRSAKTRKMRDQQRYRANADKYKEAAREAYESSTERNFKGGGRKAYSANFKHMHIADSRHKGRRIAINVQQWT